MTLRFAWTRRGVVSVALSMVFWMGTSLEASAATKAAPSVEARLEGFDDYPAKMMKEWNAPGLGVGIVVGDIRS